MKLGRLLVLGGALCLSIFSAPHGSSQTYQGKELVKASLVADADAVVPGKPFTVGLLLRMAPGWHTYWKFSGDAGLPTELKWKMPPGWKIGEIQWPIPLKLKDPGDIQTYGYSDEVLLMQEITPPDKIDNSSVELFAEANWLVCERLCIPGGGTLHITLPRSATSAPANTEIFARFRGLLAQPWPEHSGLVTQSSRSGPEIAFTLKNVAFLAKYPFVDFYPLPDEKAVVGHPKVDLRGPDELTFRIPFETAPPNRVSGLIIAGESSSDEHRTGWLFTGETSVKNSTTSASSQGLLTFLFFGFVGGIILNLMPCVLPVISLKLFGFIQHAGQSREKILRSGLAFAAGIFAWFIGLALLLIVLKGAGHQITWAFQFTNPYFVLFMSVVVLVFALNLFGVFEISLPQGATRGLLGWTASEGEAGSFFQGVFATILATPCTAPFLGTALGFAFTQSAIVILTIFLAIAAGMSAPYVLLCAQPAWLRFLPKPGAWMLRVKQFMGFLLLATLLFLLYVLGAQRGLDGAIWASCFLLIVSIACWMKGAFVLPTVSSRARAIAIVTMSILVVVGGFYFIGEKFHASKIAATDSQLHGDWQAFTPERLRTELEQGHSVFVDFTAAWCLTCKFNEASVLESAAVQDAFQRHGIVKLRADWTNGDPAITKLLKQFGRPGVPLYVLYPGKSAEPIVFPELLTKSIILNKLETISRTVASQ